MPAAIRRLQPAITPVAFALVFAGTLLVAMLQSPEPFYYDSGSYWELGQTFTLHGHFSLVNFNSPLRGYLLPLLTHCLREIGAALQWTSSSMAKLFNALTFALIGAVLTPRLAEIAWPNWRWGLGRRIALGVLLLVFWSGFLNFPLSDFPALAMTLLALVAVERKDAPGWMLVSGAACGAAIDTRPSYLLLAPVLIGLVAWSWFDERNQQHASRRRRSLCMSLFIAGLLLVSLPQSLSSHRHYNTWSFIPGSAVNLTGFQLSNGLRIQRYETYVGTGHGPQMFYEDEAGKRILAEQPNETVTGIGQYLKIVVKHPVTMTELFLRHLINGLDQRNTTPYIKNVATRSHRWLRLAGFLLVFLALLRVLWPTARRRFTSARWRYPVALLLCCLTSIPSAVETRYLLPAYLLSYVMVLLPGWPSPIGPSTEGLRRYRTLAIIAFAFVVFAAIAFHVASEATRQVAFG
jgi:hypothetical protein